MAVAGRVAGVCLVSLARQRQALAPVAALRAAPLASLYRWSHTQRTAALGIRPLARRSGFLAHRLHAVRAMSSAASPVIDVEHTVVDGRVPVTIITGFLGCAVHK